MPQSAAQLKDECESDFEVSSGTGTMPWYAKWFDDETYLDVYRHRDTDDARRAVDLVIATTAVSEGDRVLDLACGTGRHAFEFARRGLCVVAADLSEMLLSVAKRKIRKYAERLTLVRADMRRLPFTPSFDLVAQLFTAFGYFERDHDNAAVIEGVARVLKPGGRYILDFFNAEYLLSHALPHSEHAVPGGHVVQDRRIRNGRIEKTIRIHQHGAERHYVESVRLYSSGDLVSMFIEHGFDVECLIGDYDGRPHTADAPRCILVGQLNR